MAEPYAVSRGMDRSGEVARQSVPPYVIRWRNREDPQQEAPAGSRAEAVQTATTLIIEGKCLARDVVIYEHTHIRFDVVAREEPRPAEPPLR